MTRSLVCIHTLPLLIAEFERLGHAMIDDLKMMHILDEPLLARVQQANSIGPEELERLESHIRLADRVGAGAVIVTCSTLSPVVADLRANAPIPLIAIDEGMASLAVAEGKRIGVITTAESTIAPTRTMLMTQAARSGRQITLTMHHVTEALELLLAGDGDRHDRLVREAIDELVPEVDVIVLAQASMARVLDIIPEGERKVPLLSSPHIALAEARNMLG